MNADKTLEDTLNFQVTLALCLVLKRFTGFFVLNAHYWLYFVIKNVYTWELNRLFLFTCL